MSSARYFYGFIGIAKRELYRVLQQRSRFLSSLVRPLLWLAVFAAGFRAALGLAIIPPYQSYITYEVYIVPGLVAMMLLFNGMQSSLSMVYDRELGSMRILLTSPLPRPFLLASKLIASALVSAAQVYAFLLLALLFEFQPPLLGYLYLLPAVLLSGFMLAALGLLLSSLIRQLENFAGVMNFVVFPMFFMSSALYPLWKIRESSDWLYTLCTLNPFSYAVELIRFSLYGQLNMPALLVCSGCALAFWLAAVMGYDPKRGLLKRKAGGT